MSARLSPIRSACIGKLPRWAALLGALVVLFAVHPSGALAAVSCPNGNPVLNENNCMGAGSSGFEMSNYNDNIGGFSVKTSYNLGDAVQLKIGRNLAGLPTSKVNIDVYRIGDYGGAGGRRIAAASATNVTVNNNQTCNPMDPVTGKLDCGNWAVTYSISGSAIPASGVYVAKLTTTDSGIQNQVLFIVRDDSRASKVLYVVPTADYQAYNNWGGKSLYFDKDGGANTVTGTDRAAKVSFNRPFDNAEIGLNRFFGPDYDMITWLEQQGYDVAYSDDVAVSQDPNSLKQHKLDMTAGHSEYWTAEEYHGFKAARDAGVNISSFDSNTAYWKVRYEDGGRTLVCYKTVQGAGAGGSGAVTPNDPGPDGQVGTADDAVGADGIAGTSDDHPENSTTTWRDNGAANGDPSAPPGGRVGPNEPENSLWGNMYVGDNDSQVWPLNVAPTNTNGEYAGDRIWRNAGIATNTNTKLGTTTVGWEWDAVPTQSQYLAFQPSGVKRLTSTDVADSTNSWIQDEGRLRATTPPPGQPSTVNAVKYRAASGAWIFAAGTNYWANNLDDDRIAQATYNILSDQGALPATPVSTLTLDPAGSNQPPVSSFTASPTTVHSNQTVTFDGSDSDDSDGTVVKYEWDLNGDGTYETNTGTTPVATKSYTAEGDVDVRLRVTDNGGATDFSVKTVTVIDNQPPRASFTVSPNPVVAGQDATFNGSSSSDSDGTIAKYEWDFDGNGTYETNAGSSTTTTHSFSTSGTVSVGLKVTDNGGKTATTTLPVTVSRGGVSNYGDEVLDTAGLVDYWRMGESSGTTLADSKGTSNATTFGGVTLGVPGGVAGDPNTAARFDGAGGNAKANLNLSTTSKVTVEFWMNWNQFANDDRLAMEFTSSYHDNAGGFLIDPDAPQQGGTFAVGIGMGAGRNTAYFARPSAGAWHHYAFVLDTTAPAAQQIIPYIDGQPVAYTKLDSGTGAGPFANSTLYMMSRAGSQLFGLGDLDELAIYNTALSASTIDEHYASYGTNRRPVARFTNSPSTPKPNQTVTFNGSTSSDPDGTIAKYEWDLDGNGSYETNTGSTPTATKTYSAEGAVSVGLKVTDNQGGTDTESHTINVVANQPPTAAFTASPNPAVLGQATQFNGSGSADVDGTIAKYEWDLDGNGTYETDTGTTKTTSKTYTATGTTSVGLRVTDDGGKTATTTLPVTVNSGGVSNYGDAVLDTAGLVDYWRMGETTGPNFADSKGTTLGTTANGTTFGVPGGPAGDPNTATRYDGVDDSASANVDLSGTGKVTIEFWLKWNAFANDDRLAMEFTNNFNNNNGGFLIDPNAPQNGGTFGVGIGGEGARNSVFFNRPSAGQWHHYAFVFDTSAAAAQQITPYVDGTPVTYTQTGASAGNFANSTLYMMSRGGSSLFGSGDLDEVAVYNRALAAGAIQEHFESSGTNRRPVARFTASPTTARAGQTVTFNGSTSSDPDGSIVHYEWDLDGNGSYETDSGSNPVTSRSYPSDGPVDVKLRVYDDANGTDTEVHTITIGNDPPTASFSATPNPVVTGGQVSFDASASSDPDDSIAKYEWDLDGDGTYETDTATTKTTTRTYTTAGNVTVKLRVTDQGGLTATDTKTIQVVPPQQPPTASFTATPNPANTGATVTFNGSGSSDSDGTIAKYEWDLDGNGSYETDTGTTSSATKSYAAAGTVNVGLRVTDGDGMTATKTVPVYVNGSGTTYSERVLATAGLDHYWRMGETTGTTLADSKGTSTATTGGGPTLGASGAVDSNGSVGFDAVNDYASAAVDLSSASKVTLEFWLKWNAFANDDALAMEFTPNFNDNAGGFLVDPNSPQNNGQFGIGIGNGAARNNAFFARPTAGAWHHYAIVIDTAAPAATQIVPYVDGQPVAYTKAATGTGTTFANSTLYFMSRAGTALFGGGNLDELAVYSRPLSAAEIAAHYTSGINNPPTAAFTSSPEPANVGQTVTFNGSTSSDSDGTIAKYEWDLDGNGTYETDTGTTATTTKSYTAPGTVAAKLRVTDNKGATATVTHNVTVRQAPTAAFTLTPNPANVGQTVAFNGSTSTATGATITKYEWDLDGNGTYETVTNATPTTSRSYTTAGAVTVGLRVTDSNGLTGTVTHALTVNGAPTASFTVSPSPAQTRGTVTFNGSASSVVGGTITKYEWDLDGNGTYETVTNATPTTTKVYDTESAITVGLRVTASNGLTATTTRSLTIQSLYAQAVRTTAGLRAYWRLAETTGTTAQDETTNNLDGTYENTPTLGTAGLLVGDSNKAIDLTRSSSERVTVADNTLLDPTNLTLEAWVRPDSSLSFGQTRTIFAKTNSSGNDFSYSLDYRRSGFSTNQLVFSVTTTSNTTYTVTQTLTSGTKYHVAATYNGSTMRIYVNGVEVGSGQSKTGNLRNSAQPLRIGAYWSQDYWDGAIDEAAVYSTALPVATLLAHYNNGK